ncbi:MAG: hypothetical protein IJS59_02210 [Bacteroidaceae bacterium]|nr:hypothetical protein [Bacteroidaceae bacterium]
MKQNIYVSPALHVTTVAGSQMIANSPLDTAQPTNISGITGGGTASADDEAGVKGSNYSVWDDDWSR